MRPFVRNILFSLFVLGSSAAFSSLHAQSNSGSISGTVSDPSGAVIPGAVSFHSKSRQRLFEDCNDRQCRPVSVFRTSRSTPTTLPSSRMASRHSSET